MINLPAWTPMQLEVDGQLLDLEGEVLQSYTRSLDMRQALMQQSINWRTSNDITVKLVSERLVSMAQPHFAAIHWRIEVDADCEVRIHSALDSRVNNRFAETHFDTISVDDTSITITTVEEKYRVCVMTDHIIDAPETKHGENHRTEKTNLKQSIHFR